MIGIAKERSWSASWWLHNSIVLDMAGLLGDRGKTELSALFRDGAIDRSWVVSLDDLSVEDFRIVQEAAEFLYSRKREGGKKEWKGEPAAYGVYMNRFLDLIRLLREDDRSSFSQPG